MDGFRVFGSIYARRTVGSDTINTHAVKTKARAKQIERNTSAMYGRRAVGTGGLNEGRVE